MLLLRTTSQSGYPVKLVMTATRTWLAFVRAYGVQPQEQDRLPCRTRNEAALVSTTNCSCLQHAYRYIRYGPRVNRASEEKEHNQSL